MTVAELHVFLLDLSKFLRSSDAAKPAGEIEYLCVKLLPFREMRLKDFGNILTTSEERSKGALPSPKVHTSKKAKVDPATIRESCNRVIDLYNRAVDPSVTIDQIEEALGKLESNDPPKPTLDAFAKQMGFEQKFKSKAEVLKAIRQRIIGRKGAADRINA